MSKVLIEEQTLYDIGDAIRKKTGGSATYKPGEMVNAIGLLNGDVISEYATNNRLVLDLNANKFAIGPARYPDLNSATTYAAIASDRFLSFDTALTSEIVKHIVTGSGFAQYEYDHQIYETSLVSTYGLDLLFRADRSTGQQSSGVLTNGFSNYSLIFVQGVYYSTSGQGQGYDTTLIYKKVVPGDTLYATMRDRHGTSSAAVTVVDDINIELSGTYKYAIIYGLA